MMNRYEYLKELEHLLKTLPVQERAEILADFEEHFDIGAEQGKAETEIAASLGSPQQIAKEMLATRHVESARSHATTGNVLRATWAVIGLSFFNLVFVLGPFLGIVGVLIGGWAASIAFICAPLLILFDILFFNAYSHFNLFASIFLSGAGILLGIAMLYASRFIKRQFVRYLNMNASFVKGGMKHETR